MAVMVVGLSCCLRPRLICSFCIHWSKFLVIKRINKDRITSLNAEYELKLKNIENFLDMFSDLLEQVEAGKK